MAQRLLGGIPRLVSGPPCGLDPQLTIAFLVASLATAAATALGSDASAILLDFDRGFCSREVHLEDDSARALELLSVMPPTDDDQDLPPPLKPGSRCEVALTKDRGIVLRIEWQTIRSKGHARLSVWEVAGTRKAILSVQKLNQAAKRIAARRRRNQARLHEVQLRAQSIAQALPPLRATYAATAAGTPLKMVLFHRLNELQAELRRAPTTIGQLKEDIIGGERAAERVEEQLTALQELAEKKVSLRYRLVDLLPNGEPSEQRSGNSLPRVAATER